MNSNPSPIVKVTRRLPFPAERVFDAWLDPKLAARWLFATDTGEMVRAEVDARVGGRFSFTDRRNGEDVEHTGKYLEIERPRRLVFTFGVPKYSKNFDHVAIDIAPLADGCELTLTQQMSPESSEWEKRTQDGWTMILESMAAAMGDPRAETNRASGELIGPDAIRFVRLLPGPIERVWDYFTDGEKRGRWFASGPLELRPGGRGEFLFRHVNLAPEETPPESHREVHDPGVTMPTTILQCAPPRLLVFTMPGGESQPDSEVTVELATEGENVRLTLTHRRLGSSAYGAASIGAGWHTHLALLISLLSQGTPPPFWSMHTRLKERYAGMLAVVK
jgi:uncharacterized protein YndB with AHSA1/START domain